MKITLDIPDTTTCAFINYIFYNTQTVRTVMSVKCLDSDVLVDGNEIKVEPLKGDDDK